MINSNPEPADSTPERPKPPEAGGPNAGTFSLRGIDVFGGAFGPMSPAVTDAGDETDTPAVPSTFDRTASQGWRSDTAAGTAADRVPMVDLPAGGPWLQGVGDSADVVLSSRVRLARNIAGFPFSHQATDIDRIQMLDIVRGRLSSPRVMKQLSQAMHAEAPDASGASAATDQTDSPQQAAGSPRITNGSELRWADLHTTNALTRTILVERQLISKAHATGKVSGPGTVPDPALSRAVAASLPDEHLSIMVGEEDHLRIQVMGPGLSLAQIAAVADRVDDAIEQGLDFAYHPRFGYMTACPTNVGTGIRLSVLLHLPGLQLTGEIDKVKRSAEDMGLAVRGFFGEGSESTGNFYQISNQQTLGQSEAMLLSTIASDIVPSIIEYERRARTILKTRRTITTEDAVHRAHGTLANARLLSVSEAMKLLSLLRLGVSLRMTPEWMTYADVHALILMIQPGHLQRLVGRELDQQQRRIERARLCRYHLGHQQAGQSRPGLDQSATSHPETKRSSEDPRGG